MKQSMTMKYYSFNGQNIANTSQHISYHLYTYEDKLKKQKKQRQKSF